MPAAAIPPGVTVVDHPLIRVKLTRMRSVRQNAFFHALIQAAFENQRGGPKVDTWEHLKGWLLVEAGHFDEARFSIGSIHPSVAALVGGGFAKEMRKRWSYMATGVDTKRNEIYMRFPQSVSFKSCDAERMKQVVDRVTAIICTEVVPGMDPETIMKMSTARAA
jgi:hypothetical protein